MDYSRNIYFFIKKTAKVFLGSLRYGISAFLPKNTIKKRSLYINQTLRILSSLSYRTGELNDYLKLVADNVSEMLGSDWVAVTLCREGQEQILASSIKLAESSLEGSIHGTVTETVVNTGKCLCVEDTSIDPRFGAVPEGYLAYLGSPMRLPTGEIIGTICSFYARRRKFTSDQINLVEIFAERAATAIDNYNLYKQQQEMNLELKKSEEQLRQIAENLEPLLWMYSHDGEPIYMSPMFEKVWGIPLAHWYADSMVCLNAVHPQEREKVLTAFNRVFSHSANYDLEYRIIRPDGNIRMIRDRAFLIVDESGAIYRVAGISEDITERQQEQQRTIKAMARLSEIGELTSTIVHEVRNPLTTVMMGLNFFERMDLSESARKRLLLALDEAERLKRLLNEILLYAKHEVLQLQPVDLNALTLEIIENILANGGIEKQIIFMPLAEPFWVSGDQDKLKQVLINLLQNACEAEGEEISVSFSSLTISHQICIRIRNGGTPIPSEILSKITQPFFTTKSAGNGLGLAIVKKIVEAHEGSLEIESSAIAGTVVSVILPALTNRSFDNKWG